MAYASRSAPSRRPGRHEVEPAAAGQVLVDREDEAARASRKSARRPPTAIDSLNEARRLIRPSCARADGLGNLEVLLEARGFQVEVDHQHTGPAPREDVGHVGHGHRAADAALVRIERDDHRVRSGQSSRSAPIRRDGASFSRKFFFRPSSGRRSARLSTAAGTLA